MREFGFDPTKTFRAIRGIPWFLRSYFAFLKLNGIHGIQLAPVLLDRSDSSGNADGHYFWQDLICARWVYETSPSRHLDIGSRIDGFISHLLSFREVEVVDIRQPESEIPGVISHVSDAQQPLVESLGRFESVSSLHSIEHFGLGRYGDTLDPNGHLIGLQSISNLVSIGGYLYLSYPTGDGIVQFNSQRLLEPRWALDNLPNFNLIEFVIIPWRGSPHFGKSVEEFKAIKTGSCVLFKLRRFE